MAWVWGALSAGCLLVGVLHLVRLAALRRDVLGEASHAAMGLGMAAMFSPLGNPVPAPVWTVVFVLCAAWFAALALRARSIGGDAGHHVVGSAAMLFMLLSGGPQHMGHLAGGAEGVGLVSLAAVVLAGYFGWHVLRCADRIRSCVASGAAGHAGGAVGPAVVLRRPAPALLAPRTAAGAHLVMGVAMTVMLVGMI